jgi:hypothetical protein
MEGSPVSIWFFGDPADPWSGSIVEALTRDLPSWYRIRQIDETGSGLLAIADTAQVPNVVVLHRTRLAAGDADRWADACSQAGFPAEVRTILCHGDFVRQAELERWTVVVDELIPEAVALDVLAGRLSPLPVPKATGEKTPEDVRDDRDRSLQHGKRVRVVSTDLELVGAIGEFCRSQGDVIVQEPLLPSASEARLSDSKSRGLTIWEVPQLEPGWPAEMERLARSGPLIALLAFPRRDLVTLAKSQGAFACLPLPCHFDDLALAMKRAWLRFPRLETPTQTAGLNQNLVRNLLDPAQGSGEEPPAPGTTPTWNQLRLEARHAVPPRPASLSGSASSSPTPPRGET